MTAPFGDLRSYLRFLEDAGRLRRVTQPVDPATELACIARWAVESTPPADAYGILFERVGPAAQPLAVNLFPTHELYAAALGTTTQGVLERWAEALDHPLEPAPVAVTPVHEEFQEGTAVDVTRLPAPVWTPGRDAGPYQGAGDRGPKPGLLSRPSARPPTTRALLRQPAATRRHAPESLCGVRAANAGGGGTRSGARGEFRRRRQDSVWGG